MIFREINRTAKSGTNAKRLVRTLATQTAKFADRTTIKMGSQGLVTDEVLRDAEQTFSGVARGSFYDYIADFEDKFA